MKTKILIAVLSIGLLSTATVIAQEKKEMKMNHSKMEMKMDSVNEIYTCSMHPDVKSDKPGECPKCGMKLMKKKMEMYTCSMHPDVKSDKPGECPKCGMKLMKKKMEVKKIEVKKIGVKKMEMKEKQEHKH